MLPILLLWVEQHGTWLGDHCEPTVDFHRDRKGEASMKTGIIEGRRMLNWFCGCVGVCPGTFYYGAVLAVPPNYADLMQSTLVTECLAYC
jgi:hypothetical protein